MNRTITLILPLLVLLFACSSNKEKDENKNEETTDILPDKPTEVKTKLIKVEMFHYELVSNGTVSAIRKADLRFQTSEVVTGIFVKNGDKVVKGQKLASLDTFKLRSNLEQTKDNLERARLELQDVLIGQGYSLNNQSAIPEDIMKIAKVKSNFDQSRINYEMAEYNLENASLIAPFPGVVANLFSKENNVPINSEPFCTIVDIKQPEVVFMVLENELSLVGKGDGVLVSPFSSGDYVSKGKILEINPVVDKNGMVRIKAIIDNSQNKFYDGMNVRVRVQRAVDKQLLIPKSALVLRNNRKVVFTAKNGHAQWVYVETSLENSESYVVNDELHEGDSVIVDGNINLAHESPIVVR